jgi:hypothetical protein
MNHPIQEYWQTAFAPYRVGPHEYRAEQMPDPILSANFLSGDELGQTEGLDYFNLVQEQDDAIPEVPGFALRNSFYLCRMAIKDEVADFAFRVEPLEQARNKPEHLDILRDSFPKDFEFLKKLEKFLPTLEAEYLVGNIFGPNKELIATLTLGVAGPFGKLISGAVHSAYREQKVSRKLQALVHHMGREAGVRETFYWTKSERLTRYADSVDRYLVYVKA